MKYPKMVRIKQHFNTSPIKDIPAKVRTELAGIQPQKIIASGDTVAITAGSRGIANLAAVLGGVTAAPHPQVRKKFWNITESPKRPWECLLNHR